MTKTESYRQKLLEHLGNPENEIIGRCEYGPTILGISDTALRKHFTPAEVTEIENEALEIRRKKYAPQMARADMALLRAAEKGDTTAIKLAYQRFEGWSEKHIQQNEGQLVVEIVKFDNGKNKNPEQLDT